MSTELKLFPGNETLKYRAYMSSALTGFPSTSPKEEEKIRNEVLKLNKDTQELCKGLNVELYLPQDSSNPSSSHDDGLNPDEVYFLDRWRIAESDFMILNADNLSFGVGQEMEIATSMGIPSIIFYRKGKTVSRMIKGAPCIFIPDGFDKDESYIEYEDVNDLFNQLDDRIRIIKETIKFDENLTNKNSESFGKKLKDIRERNKLGYADLSQLTGFSESFLKLLETEIEYFRNLAREKDLNNKNFIDLKSDSKFSNPGLYILESLSKALEVEINQLLPISTQIASYAYLDNYKEALLVVKPDVEQLFKINSRLNFDFYSKQAAFDGNKSLTKDALIEKIKEIINE